LGRAFSAAVHHFFWTSALICGLNHFLPEHENFNSYLAESTLRFADVERVWARIENVDRTNELLLGKTAGAARDLPGASWRAYRLTPWAAITICTGSPVWLLLSERKSAFTANLISNLIFSSRFTESIRKEQYGLCAFGHSAEMALIWPSIRVTGLEKQLGIDDLAQLKPK